MSERFFALIVVMLMCEPAAAQNAGGIDRAAWLQGCWELKAADRSVEEMWSAAKGGSMIGISRTVRDGKLAEYEMVVLRERAIGSRTTRIPQVSRLRRFSRHASARRSLCSRIRRTIFRSRSVIASMETRCVRGSAGCRTAKIGGSNFVTRAHGAPVDEDAPSHTG